MHRQLLTALLLSALPAFPALAQPAPPSNAGPGDSGPSAPESATPEASAPTSPAPQGETSIDAPEATPAPTNTPAERSKPMAQPIIDTVPQARDIPWTPGTIQLDVDATDTMRRIIRVKETIPVGAGGPLTLLFPEWLPGKHAARGDIDKLAGLTINTSDGQPIAWTRDPLNVFAFHLTVPDGAAAIVAQFQFLAPTDSHQGRIMMTDKLLDLQWSNVSLYPAGYYVRDIPIQARITLPEGWAAATALRGTTSGNVVNYGETDYQTLVDSPIFAGLYTRKIDLGHAVSLDLFADDPAELKATPAQIAVHKKLVDEALALFGAQHFDHYDFLLALSDQLGGIGLEHHRESENVTTPGYFTKWDEGPGSRNLLPHEFTHSWNGKFRRPEMLWTPDYHSPMEDSLLWVYEGQTQFWGYVLGARSGLYTAPQTLDALAAIAGRLDMARGRSWRPLIDTTYDPIIAARRPKAWPGWQRSEDYYNEGLLIWLEADGILRQQTKGQKGMDDFAKAFFGMRDGDWGELTYARQDVIDTLNKIAPYDWAGFFTKRVDEPTEAVDTAGFTLGGYKLVYNAAPNSTIASRERSSKTIDQRYGVGLVVGEDGKVRAVVWDSPAFKAAMTVGAEIASVDGAEFSPAAFRAALKASSDPAHPLSLIVKQATQFRTITLDYSGGIRYPHLEKTGEGETSLDRLLLPQTGGDSTNQP